MGVEIERRFLVSVRKLPANLDKLRHLDIEQGYNGIRLRRSIDGAGREKFEQCDKKGSGRKRKENEKEIDQTRYWMDWDKIRVARLQKMRYFMPWNGYIIEINIFRNKLEPLVLAEVEFRSERQAEKFVPPVWFGRDVTDDARYTGSNLARDGLKLIKKEVLTINKAKKLMKREKVA
jgi:CYTH domain-containing protein